MASVTPHCPLCGQIAERGPIVTQRRWALGFGAFTESGFVSSTARWHTHCWRLQFARP